MVKRRFRGQPPRTELELMMKNRKHRLVRTTFGQVRKGDQLAAFGIRFVATEDASVIGECAFVTLQTQGSPYPTEIEIVESMPVAVMRPDAGDHGYIDVQSVLAYLSALGFLALVVFTFTAIALSPVPDARPSPTPLPAPCPTSLCMDGVNDATP